MPFRVFSFHGHKPVIGDARELHLI
jgi:hypothetical protein